MTEPARSIGKLGFRKRYERRLIESHAWLISCFLCGLAIAASQHAVCGACRAYAAFKVQGDYPKMSVRCR